MEPERLLLSFERAPEEAGLTGVNEAIRALGQHGVQAEAVARNTGVDGLVGRVLRFWFPYLWSAGITGVVPGAGAEVGEFVITLAPGAAFGAGLGEWLRARSGRKVRVKFDDSEIEAQTPEQVDALAARLEALRESRKSANGARATSPA